MSVDYLLPEHSLDIVRGASRTFSLFVEAPGELLDYFDLTGAAIFLSVKRRIEDALPVIQKSTLSQGILIVTPREGHAEVDFTPQDTLALDSGDYVYDLWVVSADGGRVQAIPPSLFQIQPSVTILPA